RSEAYFVFPLAQGTPGKQRGLAATGDYQPSLRSPWLAAKEMEAARLACERTGEAARCFRDFRYRTRKSWSCERRVIGKAEYLPGKANPRFVVTNLSTRDADAQHLYEDLYCARGEMEKFIGNEFSRKPRRGEAQGCAEQNRIKEQQLGLFADRTSSATLRANQLRLYFSSFAYVLLHGLR
ncbi:transposase, partial [Thiolapillus sp.]|uniref:transposase n=1 Tax=Thiolapillus sp. TaxID=2017437 RepID=UPI003AF80626